MQEPNRVALPAAVSADRHLQWCQADGARDEIQSPDPRSQASLMFVVTEAMPKKAGVRLWHRVWDFDRGSHEPGRHAAESAVLLGITERRFHDRVMTPQATLFRVPHPDPGAALLGRTGALDDLHRLLTRGSGRSVITALQGTGGIGKTQLAAAYCYAHQSDYLGGVVWISLADPAKAVDELAAWARELGLNAVDASRETLATALLGRLRSQADALLVLDNLRDPSALNCDLPGLANSTPRGLGCRVLVTSREPVPDYENLRLDFLRSPDDCALLLRESGRDAPATPAESAALDQVLTLLGGLPLALILTGRLLADPSRRRLGFAGLCDVLRDKGAVEVLTARSTPPRTIGTVSTHRCARCSGRSGGC
jgi:hypothetical protein